MKFTVVRQLLLVSSFCLFGKAFGAEFKHDSCLVQISAILEWPELTSEQSNCLQTNSQFRQAINVLCTKTSQSKTDLSQNYKNYRSIQAAIESAERNSADARKRGNSYEAAQWDLKATEYTEQWEATTKPQIDGALGILGQTLFLCTKNNS